MALASYTWTESFMELTLMVSSYSPETKGNCNDHDCHDNRKTIENGRYTVLAKS